MRRRRRNGGHIPASYPENRGGPRGVVAGVIEQAIIDMRRKVPTRSSYNRHQKEERRRRRKDAIIWLASAAARPWFAEVELDQLASLQAMGWAPYARRLLTNKRLNPAERQLLARVLLAVEP